MRTELTLWLSVSLLTAHLAILPVSAHAQELVTLEISGDAGAGFSGDCRVISIGKPEKRYRIQGKVPAKYWIPGSAIRCSLQKANPTRRLMAQISRGNTVELQTVSAAPMRWLSLMSAGPWGAAKGIASAARPLWQ
jgi:hypothetical protein